MMLRYLDSEAYGLSILFFQILGYLSLMDFGLSTAVIRSMSLYQPNEEDDSVQVALNRIISTSLFFSTGLGLIILLIVVALIPFVGHMFTMRTSLVAPSQLILLSLGINVLITFMQRGLGGMFFAHHRQVLITLPTVTLQVLSVIATVYLLSIGVGLWAFAYVNFATAGIGIVILLIMVRIYYPQLRISWRYFDVSLLKELYGFGFFMFVASLATQVILHTDRLVIGRIISLSAVAMFSITVRIPEVCMTLLTHVTFHSSPALTEILNHGNTAQVRQLYHRLTTLTVVLAVLAFWLMLIMNEWFIDLWVGPKLFAGTLVLALALLVMVQQTVTRTGVLFLNAKGVARPISLMSIIEAVLNISVSVYMGMQIGLPGVLLGTVIASLCTSGWYVPYLMQRHLQLSLKDWVRPFLKPVAVLSITGGLLFYGVAMIRTTGFPTGWITFFLTGAAVGLVLAVVAWLGFLREQLAAYVPARLRPFVGLSNAA